MTAAPVAISTDGAAVEELYRVVRSDLRRHHVRALHDTMDRVYAIHSGSVSSYVVWDYLAELQQCCQRLLRSSEGAFTTVSARGGSSSYPEPGNRLPSCRTLIISIFNLPCIFRGPL